MANILDYQKSTRYQAQPFYEAGSTLAIDFIHRKEGDTYSTGALLQSKEDLLNPDKDNKVVVTGCGVSGMAGTTFYQMHAQLIKV